LATSLSLVCGGRQGLSPPFLAPPPRVRFALDARLTLPFPFGTWTPPVRFPSPTNLPLWAFWKSVRLGCLRTALDGNSPFFHSSSVWFWLFGRKLRRKPFRVFPFFQFFFFLSAQILNVHPFFISGRATPVKRIRLPVSLSFKVVDAVLAGLFFGHPLAVGTDSSFWITAQPESLSLGLPPFFAMVCFFCAKLFFPPPSLSQLIFLSLRFFAFLSVSSSLPLPEMRPNSFSLRYRWFFFLFFFPFAMFDRNAFFFKLFNCTLMLSAPLIRCLTFFQSFCIRLHPLGVFF